MGPYLILFYINGDVTRQWTSMEVPLVPSRGSKLLGEKNRYVVSDVEYEYFLPEGVTIHVYLEKI